MACVVALLVILAPEPSRLAVTLADDASLAGRVGRVDVVQALRVRLASTGLVVVDETTVSAEWLVALSAEKEGVVVTLVGPAGATALGIVPYANRTRTEVAHTVALLVVEGLTPNFPDLSGKPPKLEPEAPPKGPSPLPATADPRDLSIDLVGSGALAWPKRTLGFGAGFMALQRFGDVSGHAEIVFVAGPSRSGDDYTIALRQLTVRLAAGLLRDAFGARFTLSLGPALRVTWLGARGTGIEDGGANVDPGLGAQAAMRRLIGPVELVVALDGLATSRFPRYIVDQQTVLSGGTVSTSASIGLGYRF